MPLIAVLGRVAVDEFLLTVGKHYRKLDARQKIRRTVGFVSSLGLPKVCYVQIWHAHFMNGVFQRTAIFNHLFDSERITSLIGNRHHPLIWLVQIQASLFLGAPRTPREQHATKVGDVIGVQLSHDRGRAGVRGVRCARNRRSPCPWRVATRCVPRRQASLPAS